MPDEVSAPIEMTRPYMTTKEHLRKEMANEEQVAIDLLPQVAETETPQTQDAFGESLL